MIFVNQSLENTQMGEDTKSSKSEEYTEVSSIPQFVFLKFEICTNYNLNLIEISDNCEQVLAINNNDNNFFELFINNIVFEEQVSNKHKLFLDSIKNSIENRIDWYLEVKYKYNENTIVYFQAMAKIKSITDKYIFETVIIDITNKKIDEQNTKLSEEKFSTLFNSLPDMVFVTRKSDGTILEVNDTVEKIYSISRIDIIGKSTKELNIWANRNREETLNDLISNNQNTFDLKINYKPGFVLDGVISFSQINFMGEDCYLSRFRDLTELRNIQKEKEILQDRILQMQKLDSIGRLAGGIAHDFNNMLTPILGYSEILQKQLKDQSNSLEKVNKILKAVNRAKDLVQQLLAFASKQIIEVKIVNINLITNNFISILTKTIRADIQIKCDLQFPIYNILANVDQIEQILLNLSINSQEAMPNGGVLSISTQNIEVNKESILSKELEIGEYVVLSVKDNGKGMSKETLTNIFDPFFTTKSFSYGMGLGMATVYGIVKQLNANILIESEENSGTEVKIYFKKVVSLTEDHSINDDDLHLSIDDKISVLLVDENEQTRIMAKEFLEYASYNVLDFSNFEEAFIQCQTLINNIAILICEVKLFDNKGQLLYEKLLQINPKLKILYMSDYNSNVVFRQNKLDYNNFIQKPFVLNSFLSKVGEILNN